MRCELRVTSGSQTGQRMFLRDGQTLQVGRTEYADLCVADDPLMSRVHFALDSDGGILRIRDLGSRNGSYVNGQLVESRELRHGDVIVAGQTRFDIVLENLEGSSVNPYYDPTSADPRQQMAGGQLHPAAPTQPPGGYPPHAMPASPGGAQIPADPSAQQQPPTEYGRPPGFAGPGMIQPAGAPGSPAGGSPTVQPPSAYPPQPLNPQAPNQVGQVYPSPDQPGPVGPAANQSMQNAPMQHQPPLSGQMQPDQIQPGQMQPGQMQPGQSQPNAVQPGAAQVHPVQGNPLPTHQIQPGQGSASHPLPNQPQPTGDQTSYSPTGMPPGTTTPPGGYPPSAASGHGQQTIDPHSATTFYSSEHGMPAQQSAPGEPNPQAPNQAMGQPSSQVTGLPNAAIPGQTQVPPTQSPSGPTTSVGPVQEGSVQPNGSRDFSTPAGYTTPTGAPGQQPYSTNRPGMGSVYGTIPPASLENSAGNESNTPGAQAKGEPGREPVVSDQDQSPFVQAAGSSARVPGSPSADHGPLDQGPIDFGVAGASEPEFDDEATLPDQSPGAPQAASLPSETDSPIAGFADASGETGITSQPPSIPSESMQTIAGSIPDVPPGMMPPAVPQASSGANLIDADPSSPFLPAVGESADSAPDEIQSKLNSEADPSERKQRWIDPGSAMPDREESDERQSATEQVTQAIDLSAPIPDASRELQTSDSSAVDSRPTETENNQPTDSVYDDIELAEDQPSDDPETPSTEPLSDAAKESPVPGGRVPDSQLDPDHATTIFDQSLEDSTMAYATFSSVFANVAFEQGTSKSGLRCYRSHGEKSSPSDIAKSLIERNQAFLLVNVERLDPNSQASLTSQSGRKTFLQLSDKFGLIGKTDPIDMPNLIRANWGKDAVVLVISSVAKSHIQSVLMSRLQSYAFPSILSGEMERVGTLEAQAAFQEIDAFMVESDYGRAWTIYLRPDFQGDWSKLGLPCPPVNDSSK